MLARVATVAGIIGVIIAAATFFRDWRGGEANLEVAEIQARGSEISVKLFNTGDQVAIIHQAKFVITHHRFTSSTERRIDPGPPYQVEFPIDPSVPSMMGAPIIESVSQEVKAGEGDWFTLVIGVPPPPPGELNGVHFFETRLSLLYNHDKELKVGEATIEVQAVSSR